MAPVVTAPKVSDFFLRLGDDPNLLGEFERDPAQAMAAAGLTSKQILTVLTGGPEGVRKAVDSELLADPVRRHLIITPRMVVQTEPEPEPKPKPKPKPKRRRLA